MALLRLILITVLASLTGCAWAYTPARVTTLNVENVQSPGQIVSLEKYKKTGRACGYGVLLFSFGDTSLETARKDGEITRIALVEYETYNTLGIYAKLCTIVKGE